MLEKLNPRERLFIVGGGGFLLLMLLLFLGVKVKEQRDNIRQSVQEARDDVTHMQRLVADIRSMPAGGPLPDENELQTRTTQVLEGMKLTMQNIRSRKETPSPREEQIIVEITFAGVSLKDIINFLHAVEYSKQIPARVGVLEFRKPLAQREIYDVRLTLVVTRPKK